MKIIDSINSQFKLLEMNKNYYLIDVDSNFLVFIFPMLVWFVPLRATKIDRKVFNILKEKGVKKTNYIIFIAVGLIVGRVLHDSTASFFENLNYSFTDKIIGVIIVIIVMLLFRSLIAYKNKKYFLKKYTPYGEYRLVRSEKKSLKPYQIRQKYIRLIVFYSIALVLMYTYLFVSIDMIAVLIVGGVIFTFLNRHEEVPYGIKIREI